VGYNVLVASVKYTAWATAKVSNDRDCFQGRINRYANWGVPWTYQVCPKNRVLARRQKQFAHDIARIYHIVHQKFMKFSQNNRSSNYSAIPKYWKNWLAKTVKIYLNCFKCNIPGFSMHELLLQCCDISGITAYVYLILIAPKADFQQIPGMFYYLCFNTATYNGNTRN